MKYENNPRGDMLRIAEIDYCYFVLGSIAKQPKPPTIVQMVDAVTGKADSDFKAMRRTVASLLRRIIRHKKALGYATDCDAEMLDRIKALAIGTAAKRVRSVAKDGTPAERDGAADAPNN